MEGIRPKSQLMQTRALKSIPLGVNSNFRYWGDGITPYRSQSQGCLSVGCGWKSVYRLPFGIWTDHPWTCIR